MLGLNWFQGKGTSSVHLSTIELVGLHYAILVDGVAVATAGDTRDNPFAVSPSSHDIASFSVSVVHGVHALVVQATVDCIIWGISRS
jgi:hypothetical protein